MNGIFCILSSPGMRSNKKTMDILLKSDYLSKGLTVHMSPSVVLVTGAVPLSNNITVENKHLQ